MGGIGGALLGAALDKTTGGSFGSRLAKRLGGKGGSGRGSSVSANPSSVSFTQDEEPNYTPFNEDTSSARRKRSNGKSRD